MLKRETINQHDAHNACRKGEPIMTRFAWQGCVLGAVIVGTFAQVLQPSTAGPAKDGRAVAQRLADLKVRPPKGKPPKPPAFPFDATAANRYRRAYADWLELPVEWKNDLGMTFVLIPPGVFPMGSPKDEPGHNGGGFDETLHTVTLTRPFYLGKHETTVGQFRAFVEKAKYVTDIEKNGGGHAHDDRAVWKHRPGTSWRKPGFAGPFELKDDHPVVHVSHTDSRAFCQWLQKRTGIKGLSFDLPTEAQW